MRERSCARESRLQTPGGPGKLVHTASWVNGGIVLEHRHWRCRIAEPVPSRGTHHRIVLTEQGTTSRTHIRLEGRAVYDGYDRAGTLTCIPAFVERECLYRDADLVFSGLWIDPALQKHLAGCDALQPFPAMVNGNDEVISALLASLCRDVATDQMPGAAYVEHVAALILLRLASLHSTLPHKEIPGRQLSRKTLTRVQEYIEANLGVDITLSDLARLSELSLDTFARRFRATTGLAPYAYIIQRRVQRAKELLRETDMEIVEISLALGFSSQSHFTTTFRRLIGIAPRAYRRQYSPE